MANRFGVDPDKMLGTLKATAFRGDVSVEQMMALAVVADQYGLNPWTKEIYAFPDRNNGIVPVVGVDGWSRIINSNPQFDGMDFVEGELNGKSIPSWIECRMHRKDRSHPICVKEYFDEVYRDVGPWKSHPRRMLRHKAMIQCARLAFGFVGIYDEDEGERIVETINITPSKVDPRGDLSEVDYALRDKHVAEIKSILDADKEEHVIAQEVHDYVHEALMPFHELFITVNDKLAADKIISKAQFRKLYEGNPRDQR
jgi:phage recombination protein Bet